MTWKNLGFYRHKSDLCQLVYITFDGAVIAMQSPSDDCDRAWFTLDTAEHVKSTGSQQAQEIGRIFKADSALLWHRLTSVSQSCQLVPSAKEILFVTYFKGDIFHAVLLSAVQSVWN
ncbi:MAG: hypothetical protein A2535_01680 [Burkholderiales bacterium RIFOXYD2_FULL_59_8]|nr:MAG: hypothetical protein A2535_01680 [Burkholderiales bacterium RIFOXYD2_FULL_59_8]